MILFIPCPCRSFPSQILYDFTGDYKAGYGWDEGVAAGDVAAFGAFVLGAGRADAVLAAADGHVFDRAQNFFGGENDFYIFDFALFTFLTHNAGQRAD